MNHPTSIASIVPVVYAKGHMAKFYRDELSSFHKQKLLEIRTRKSNIKQIIKETKKMSKLFKKILRPQSCEKRSFNDLLDIEHHKIKLREINHSPSIYANCYNGEIISREINDHREKLRKIHLDKISAENSKIYERIDNIRLLNKCASTKSLVLPPIKMERAKSPKHRRVKSPKIRSKSPKMRAKSPKCKSVKSHRKK